jgi:hypothetical protein
MVAPLLALKPSAVVWHQGEENSEEGIEYTCLFNAMVADWRKRFEAPELPLVFVQLRACALSPAPPPPLPSLPGPAACYPPPFMLCFILLRRFATSHVPPSRQPHLATKHQKQRNTRTTSMEKRRL